MTDTIAFTVYGVPAPKGSKSAFPFRRADGSLGVNVREGKTKHPKQWEAAIDAVVAELKATGVEQLVGPLVGSAAFYLPRPASVKQAKRPLHTVRPDLSKLIRAIEDPLNGILIEDDSRIVAWWAVKLYADDGPPRAEIAVAPFALWAAEARDTGAFGPPASVLGNPASTLYVVGAGTDPPAGG